MSSTHAADQTAADAAHAGQSKATARLSADRGKADAGAIKSISRYWRQPLLRPVQPTSG
jgi:hypothetical protein